MIHNGGDGLRTMTITPNTPTVSRSGVIRAESSSLSKALRRAILDSPSNPVKALLTNDGMSIWTHDIAKTVQLIMTNAPIDGLKVKTDCVMLIDPESMASLLDTKFPNEMVKITIEPNQPIKVESRTRGSVIYHPADEDDCFMVPDHWIIPKDSDGWYQIPMLNNEACTVKVTLTRAEMSRGLIDMSVAGAPYVSYDFTPSGSTCASGHWGSKSNRSHSPVDATVTGGTISLNFTENLGNILQRLDGDNFILQKNDKTPFVIIECGSTVVVATEAQREV